MAGSGSSAVLTEGLVKRFGDVVALDGVDLQVAPGSLYAVVGPNGAGKTTLIHVLTTLLKPSAGRAWVFGHDVVGQAASVRALLGVAFQETSLELDFTGFEVLDFHGRLVGLSSRERRARIADLAQALELGGFLPRLVKTYSGGMRRRLELARALLGGPRLLVLDEPTVGLDPHSREAIWERIRWLREERGLTVLFTTHYMEEAERLADRVAIVDAGRILAEGTPHELVRQLGDEVVYVEGDGPLAELGRRLSESGAAARCWSGDGVLQVSVGSAAAALPAIVEQARELAVRLRGLNVSRPSLHDVFIRLTGRRAGQ